MSQVGSLNSNSLSELSGSSSNQSPIYQEHWDTNVTNLTFNGSPTLNLSRSGTVKRAAGITFFKKKEISISFSEGDDSVFLSRDKSSLSDSCVNNRYRRSLDSSLRRSLESISEYKPKRSFYPTRTFSTTASRCSSSLESFSTEQDNAIRSSINNKNDEEKTVQSPASSYLSWIESVHNIENTTAEVQPTDINDIDGKVGEWNNFWLNYNTARSRYMSSAYLTDRMKDDTSEAKSSNSTQKELGEKPSGEYILLTVNEAQEALKCSKKITEIIQTALIRNDHDCENSNPETSFYSESLSRKNSSLKEDKDNASIFTSEDLQKVARERSASYIVTNQEHLKQKEVLRSSVQSSSTSCINAILNTGVADILKRVIKKRRDIMTPDDMSSVTRRSFSEWSNK